jgi:hypothetical protein
MSGYDLPGLYQFLAQTPEQGLRKMLVDQKPMTDAHFSLLLKVVRHAGETEFCGHADKQDFPKVKFSPGETKVKDKFWADCFQTFKARGILNPATAKVA